MPRSGSLTLRATTEHAHSRYPEVSRIPKDGGARSNGDSYAAKKSTTERL